jgi:hypothetical protein
MRVAYDRRRSDVVHSLCADLGIEGDFGMRADEISEDRDGEIAL